MVAAIESWDNSATGGGTLQLDDHLKQLLRELGHAINDTVSDSERIADAITSVRTAGFDIVLKLDATIGLARRGAEDARMTVQDRNFLESLHIRVDRGSGGRRNAIESGNHAARREVSEVPEDFSR